MQRHLQRPKHILFRDSSQLALNCHTLVIGDFLVVFIATSIHDIRHGPVTDLLCRSGNIICSSVVTTCSPIKGSGKRSWRLYTFYIIFKYKSILCWNCTTHVLQNQNFSRTDKKSQTTRCSDNDREVLAFCGWYQVDVRRCLWLDSIRRSPPVVVGIGFSIFLTACDVDMWLGTTRKSLFGSIDWSISDKE